MRIKRILAIVMVAIMLVGCSVDEEITSKTPDKKKEIVAETEIRDEEDAVSQGEDEGTSEDNTEVAVEETTVETVPTEQTQSEETKKTEQKKAQTKTEMPTVTTPVVNEPVIATPESEVKKEECNHWYQPVETKNCASIKQMVWACNGCGYALFDISSTDYSPINFPNMYVHPPCETDRFDEPCCGGGYHSEAYYYWEGCYECHAPIILRSCTTFYVMAERCIQNESNFGPYEKVETGHAYIKSCDCGKNLMVSGEDGGMMLLKEQCCYCGDVKTYPEL